MKTTYTNVHKIMSLNKMRNYLQIFVTPILRGGATLTPGSPMKLEVFTGIDSDVALLAVDKGLYALNNKNKLTREQARTTNTFVRL